MTGRLEVSPPRDEADLDAFEAIDRQAFLPTAEQKARYRDLVGPANFRVVRRGGRVAGGLALIPMGQWFGDRSVPMTGVAAVAVAPEHRATGAGSRLMRRALEELHDAGVALSVLYPATQPVYRRAGWEQAGAHVTYALAPRAIDLRDRSLELRPVEDADRRHLRAAYERFGRRGAGLLDRGEFAWARLLDDTERPVHGYLVSGDDGVEGYALFAQQRDRGFRYDVQLRDLVILTPAAARRLATFFADHRSMVDKVVWRGSPGADPLLAVLAEQEFEVTKVWHWMLRLVDVRAALAARGYRPGVEAEVHLQVRDDVLPGNDGRFLLEVADGKARVRKGGRGRLRVDVRGLAALYTGRASPEELLASGYVDGPARDLQLAGVVFAGPAPWMPDFF